MKKINFFILIGCSTILSACTTSHYAVEPLVAVGEFKHEVRQFQKPYDNQQAEQISLMV